jgi:hypothetical protein
MLNRCSFLNGTGALAGGTGSTDSGTKCVDTRCVQYDPALEQRQLADYTRLFRGLHQGDGPRPAYDSIHPSAPLMGGLAVEVRRHDEAAGLGQLATGAPCRISSGFRCVSSRCRVFERWRLGPPGIRISPRERSYANSRSWTDTS